MATMKPVGLQSAYGCWGLRAVVLVACTLLCATATLMHENQRPALGLGDTKPGVKEPKVTDILHVVVTWSTGHPKGDDVQATPEPRDIRELANLPEPAKVILYAKGHSCELRPTSLAEVYCVETVNSGGREAQTMFLHASLHYNTLARYTMFIQDDFLSFSVARITQWIQRGIPENPLDTHSVPGCLCNPVHETHFEQGKYGRRPAVLHMLRTWFNTSWEGNVIDWPSAAQMLVLRESIQRHPQSTYESILASGIITREDQYADDGQNCGVPLEEVQDLRATGNACPHALGWAHVLERMWWMIW